MYLKRRDNESPAVENGCFDAERAFYGQHGLRAVRCAFDGPEDGESAFKECSDITVQKCYFNLRYPFWHVRGLTIENSEMTELCRAAIWYSEHIRIENSKLHGIKALRECSDALMKGCSIVSSEFGWSQRGMKMHDCQAEGEYFLLRAEDLRLSDVSLQGKYAFQYVKNAVFDNCTFDTKDAFWHAENVVIRNSVIRGEYLGWYSERLTFENCEIIGTQPLCYCRALRLLDCRMTDTDLCFEKSDVEASITTPVQSIKNPRSGTITLPAVGGIIRDSEDAWGRIELLVQR